MVEPAFFALTSTPSIAPSSAELTFPASAACDCAYDGAAKTPDRRTTTALRCTAFIGGLLLGRKNTRSVRDPQPRLDDLARRRERHLGDDHQALGELVLRNAFSQQVIDQLDQTGLLRRVFQADEKAGFLAQYRVGHRYQRRLQHLGMRVEQHLDVPGVDLHAAAVDEVLAAAGDGEVPAARLAQITGAEPAVLRERFPCLRFIIAVTGKERR